ncbi:hypothetical protein ACEPAF_6821 [Sanghuangporus sanghuang]
MLPVSTLVSLLVVIIFNRRVSAQVQPTTPGPNETYTAGANCAIAWVPDSSGSWTNVTIDLMSGSNNNMSLVTNVATGLDGTDKTLTPFSWTCPEVNPYSTIYFYQLTNGDDISTRAWTTRFTIASPSNETEPAENPQQPDGESVPWGIGRLINGKSVANSSTTTSASSSSISESATASTSVPVSNSAPSSSGKKPHGRKGDGTDSDSHSRTEDDGIDEGEDEEDGEDEDDESTQKPATRTRSANISGAKSAAARATGVARTHANSSPDDSDTSSPEYADSDSSSSGASDSDSEGGYQAQSPFSNSDSNPDSYRYPDSYPRYKNSGAADAADSARATTGCRCDFDGDRENGVRAQLELSGVVSTIAPSVIIALVVLYL